MSRMAALVTQSLRIILLMTALCLLCDVKTVTAQSGKPGSSVEATNEWPQFLGPQRNGRSAETGLIDAFPADGPSVVWRVPGGVGMSGIAVARGRAVTMVQHDGKQWLISLDTKSGKTVWETPLADLYRNSMGNGPRATPAIAGDRVFAFTGEGLLSAVGWDDGKLLWSHHVLKELSGKEADYGMASSPLVVGDHVIVTAGAPGGTVVAYDAKSGKKAWTAGEDTAGYSSPTLLNVGEVSQIVAFTGASALGIAPKSGSVLWRYPFETNFDCNIACPLDVDGRIFLSAGENHGSVLLSLKKNGELFETSEVWSSFGAKSVLRNEWQTSILLNGYLYGMDNVGGAGPVTHLTCIEAATGKRMWQVPRFGKGNLIAADGKLIMTMMSGELVLARANPEKYEELSRASVLETTRQAAALSNKRLYLRDDKDIVCVDIAKK